MDDAPITYLSNDDVRTALTHVDVLGCVAAVLRRHALGQTRLPPEASLYWSNERAETARSLALPGCIESDPPQVGLKVINANPMNPDRGLPRASGLLLLFDHQTARITCVMQAQHVSSARTAAVSLVAARWARPEAGVLAVIGAGPLGRAHVDLGQQALPGLRELRVYDLDVHRSGALAEVGAALGLAATCAASARSAVEGADVVIAATTTTAPYLEMAWLAPSAVVVNVGLDDCAEDVLLECDTLLVDSWEPISSDDRRLLGRLAGSGRVVGPRGSEAPGVRRVDAELGSVLSGATPSAGQRVVVNPFGMGIEDVAVGAAARDVAVELGLGVTLHA